LSIWLDAIRIRQWSKQLLIFLPIIALGQSIDTISLLNISLVALAFSLVASTIYLYNDTQDIENDKLDLVRKNRPLASGKISRQKVRIFMFFALAVSGIILQFATNSNSRIQVASLIFIYFFMNILYSKFKLKRFKILGLIIVSIGFSIRFSVGTLILGLSFSTWAFVLIIQLAMFMLSGKRFQTVMRNSTSGRTHSDSNADLQFWLLSMVTFGAFFAATYSGFITDNEVIGIWGKEELILSTLPLGIGLVRFVEIVMHPQKYKLEDATDTMTRDLFLASSVLVYAIVMFIGRANA